MPTGQCYDWLEIAKSALMRDQDMRQSPNPYTHIVCVAEALKEAYSDGLRDEQEQRCGSLDRLVSDYASTIESLTENHENIEAVRADAELGRLVRLMPYGSQLERGIADDGKKWYFFGSKGTSGPADSPEEALQLAMVDKEPA